MPRRARTATLLALTLALALPVVASPASANPPEVIRYAGADRIETAVRVSQAHDVFAGPDVVIARADDFADAIAAGPYAARTQRRLLLTNRDSLPPLVLAELNRIGTTDVVLAGGPAAISEAVAEQLRTSGRTVRRIAGPTRFDTAVAFARADGGVCRIAIADGGQFADQLVAASYTTSLWTPNSCLVGGLLLSSNGSMTPGAEAFLATFPGRVDTFGDAAAGAWPATVHIGGHDQYMLSANAFRHAILNDADGGLNPTYRFVNGDDFPDGLSAVWTVGLDEPPILLVRRDYLPPAVADVLDWTATFNAHIGGPRAILYGGEAAIGNATLDRILLETDSRGHFYRYWSNLPAGQCLSGATALFGDGLYQDQYQMVGCDQPHHMEAVGAAHTHTQAGTYPGPEALWEQAGATCEAAFVGYVGRDSATSRWHSRMHEPTELMWNHGMRDTACLLAADDLQPYVGTARASGS